VTGTIATRQQPAGALAIAGDQSEFTAAQLEAFGIANATRGEQLVFLHTVQRTGLDPAARQIYSIARWDPQANREKFTIQTGIDGYRLIARRAANDRSETISYGETEWCGEDGVWRDVWLSKSPPAAARTTVLRNGQAFPAVALYDEYVQTKRGGEPNRMWSSMPANQLAKCAEALALRKAFPQELAGVYTDDEMGTSGEPARPRAERSAFAKPAGDVVDAEVIEETGEAITPDQLTKLHASFTGLGVRDRSDKNRIATVLVGLLVESTKELTKAQASSLIDQLDQLAAKPDRERQAGIDYMLATPAEPEPQP
jgi:phage recombination protein Bet